MLKNIKEFLNKTNESFSKSVLKAGIISNNNSLADFKDFEVIYDGSTQEIPKMDICFVDCNIDSEKLAQVRPNADIVIAIGSINSIDVDLVIPGREISDEFLKVIAQAFIDDNIDYLKPLLQMTQNNDFRTKTVLLTVTNELCVGCGGCAFICPEEIIQMKNTRPIIDFKNCIHCGSCFLICPKSWNLSEEVEAWC